MKFCPVVPEICRGQVHASRKERIRIIIIKIKIKIRNGAKTISLQTLFGRLNKLDNMRPSLFLTINWIIGTIPTVWQLTGNPLFIVITTFIM
jgi:hypothetical protein